MRGQSFCIDKDPAEKPSEASRNLSETLRIKKTNNAPTPVAKPAIKLAKLPMRIKFIIIFNCNNYYLSGSGFTFPIDKFSEIVTHEFILEFHGNRHVHYIVYHCLIHR